MTRKILIGLAPCLLLCQCSQLQSDCAALRIREAEIAQEPKDASFVGRRYYIPACRFWGYVRSSGESWRKAKLVLMDESVVHTPDRGVEPPAKDAVFGTDNNVEYILQGEYTGELAYDPSTNQALPVFKASSYEVRNRKPGFLFVPSEKYSTEAVTLRPVLMPDAARCAQFEKR